MYIFFFQVNFTESLFSSCVKYVGLVVLIHFINHFIFLAIWKRTVSVLSFRDGEDLLQEVRIYD